MANPGTAGKARRKRTKENYNAIVAACRQANGNIREAQRLSGIDRTVIARAYLEGWPTVPGAIPIKDVLQMDMLIMRATRAEADPEEQVAVAQQVLATSLDAARENAKDAAGLLAEACQRAQEAEKKANDMLDRATARLAEVENLARAKMDDTDKAAQATLMGAELEAKRRLADLLQRAKVDAAETMADEANAAKFGRKAALGAAAIAALMLKDASVVASQLRSALGDLSKLAPVQAMRVAHEMVKLVESAEKAVILALQAERLRVGQPTEVIGIQAADGGMEEREIKLKAVLRAVERSKARKLSLVQGGMDEAEGSATDSAAAAEDKYSGTAPPTSSAGAP